MAGLATFFFDSYAFFAILDKNENYNKYIKGISIVTTKLNLMEMHYGLMRRFGKEIADRWYDELVKYCVVINDSVIKEANVFRYANKHKKLSYIDCVGYIIAKSRNIKFLTGDMQFKDFENVEYVK